MLVVSLETANLAIPSYFLLRISSQRDKLNPLPSVSLITEIDRMVPAVSAPICSSQTKETVFAGVTKRCSELVGELILKLLEDD